MAVAHQLGTDHWHRAFPDAVVHRARLLPSHHLTVVDGIATTRIARTLVDLAAVVHPRRAARALDNALSAGLITTEGMEAVSATWQRGVGTEFG